MNKLHSLITVIAVTLAILMYTGAINPYKKKYLAELKAQEEASKLRVDSIQGELLLLEIETAILQAKSDSALAALDIEEEKRKIERDAHKRKMAELSKLSTIELARYFTERYRR
jgi:hypothetical protein